MAMYHTIRWLILFLVLINIFALIRHYTRINQLEPPEDFQIPAPKDETRHLSKQKQQQKPLVQKEKEELNINKEKGKEEVYQRVNATIVILTRNGEMNELKKTLEIFEKRFNHKFHYPFVLLNEVQFTQDFIDTITDVVSGKVEFGLIDQSEWSYPPHISPKKAAETREKMKDIIYGGSESYRFMCRYQSGFFFRHPLVQKYEYYWRVEPSTRLLCDVPTDPFLVMKQNGYLYGFTIALHEYMATVPTLWQTTMDFAKEYRRKNPDFNPSLLNFFANEDHKDFNGHHFWSNFEIGATSFFNSPQYLKYFQALEDAGGFFYERWGDAPVHSLGVGLFLNKNQVHYFSDIGYFHNPMSNCPISDYIRDDLKCDCLVEDSITLNGFSCVPDWLLYKEEPFWK